MTELSRGKRNTTPPDQRVNRALDALSRMARVMERSVPGMTLADFRVLSAVSEGEGRASRLSHRLAVGKPSMSAAVDSLVRRGMLSRSAHATDQRVVELAVTPAGRDALGEAQRVLGGLLGAIAAHTPDPDATLGTLAELDAAIEEEMAAFHARRHARRAQHDPHTPHDPHHTAAGGDAAVSEPTRVEASADPAKERA